jgi:hypothetical protein
MSEKPKRPWFSFHLLTGVLTMLTADGLMGIELCNYSRLLPGPVQSGWKTVDGLSAQVLVENPNLTSATPVTLQFQLRNDTARPMALRKDKDPEVHIGEHDGGWGGVKYGGGLLPGHEDFSVLKPGEFMSFMFKIWVNDEESVNCQSPHSYTYYSTFIITESRTVKVWGDYQSRTPLSSDVMEWAQTDWVDHRSTFPDLKVWTGEVQTEPIPFNIHLPWKHSKIIKHALACLAVLFAVALPCEWLLRRREARKT